MSRRSDKRPSYAGYDDEGYESSGSEATVESEDDDFDTTLPPLPAIKLKLGPNANANATRKRGTQSYDESDDDELDADGLEEDAARLGSGAASRNSFFSGSDFGYLKLKPDHANRPIWISPEDGRIILESFSPLAEQAQDFLITIAEPISRPSHIHEYRITTYSLYAAVSVGLETSDIIGVLNRLSKVPVPESIVKFIHTCTISYGKVKLVLKHNRYFIESAYADILQMLLRDPELSALRISGSDAITGPAPVGDLHIPGTLPGAADGVKHGQDQLQPEPLNMNPTVDVERDDDDTDAVHSFEIAPDSVETAKKRCQELDFPVLEEYDFRNDTRNPNFDIDLRPSTQIRPYQEKSLSKMFGNGRARSGIIVLPCGAGKTLVGITAACTVRKSVLVLCTSSVSVMQWRQQFLQWSTIKAEDISVFTSESKERFAGEAGLVVSTYSMVANTRNRSHDSQKMMDFLTSREWGFIILDEVHVVPAAMFRRVVTTIAAHAKLGLTATLVREDDKIDDLNFLIGPKLYEANWMDLAQKGHIANVQCAEVWCPMTAEFYQEYIMADMRKKMLLYIMNPTKFQACQFLIEYHERRGDKIIVFSDNVYALKAYALKLGKPFIFGATPQQERMLILKNFQHNPDVSTIFLSKVGDTSIDLPEATCLIQISSHYGSRRQEAQRLGRILRAKRRNDEGFNAFFYSLVSKDTQEMYYSTKRQAFLVDQGYAFKVITHLNGMEKLPNLAYKSLAERKELLQMVLLQSEEAAGLEIGDDADDVIGRGAGLHKQKPRAKKVQGTLAGLAGGEDMAYIEYNKSKNKELKKNRSIISKLYYK